MDSGYAEYDHALISRTCEERGWECHIEHTTIGEVMDDLLDVGDTPCSLCGRLRRGVLYRVATEIGATKIALGHHADDCIETLLLNLFFEGNLKSMPARLVSDNGAHVVIRPLVYVSEAEARAYAKECELPDRRLLLPVVRRPQPAAAAREAAAARPRARAPGPEELDAGRDAQRVPDAPARLRG